MVIDGWQHGESSHFFSFDSVKYAQC